MFSDYFLRKNVLIPVIWFMSFFMIGKVYAELEGNNTIVIWPSQGVEFFQLDLISTEKTQIDSSYGLFVADFNRLYEVTNISLGFLNVMTEQGWVVRNIPVDVSSGYPGLSTMFDLGSSGDVTSLLAYVELSTEPILNFTNVPDTLFFIGQKIYNAQGRLDEEESEFPQFIDANVISFLGDGIVDLVWQLEHPNIEQDINQCGPASVANSLQWLEEVHEPKINIPQPHIPGVNGDGSLVGELDKYMNRNQGERVSDHNFLQGKLKYIQENKLCNKLVVKHKNQIGKSFMPNEDVPNEDGGCAISKVNNDENISLIDWIITELKHGEDVELAVPGHWVDLIGGGYILGVPWIAWIHDSDQGNIGGTNLLDGGYGFSFVVSGELPLFLRRKMDVAVSESLSVELVRFNSSYGKDDIQLTWLTSFETKNAGFYPWRVTKDQYGNYKPTFLGEKSHSKQVNPEPDENCSTKIQGQLKANNSNKYPKLISAIGNSAENTCYSFTDTSNLSDGTYYYLLEDISDDGKSTFHCNQIDAVTIGQGPAIDLESAINYCKEVTGSNN